MKKPLTFREIEPALWTLCDSYVRQLSHPGPFHTRRRFEVIHITSEEISQTIENALGKGYRHFSIENKKYRVIFKYGSHLDYDAAGISDYLIHRDQKRRERFHACFKNNKGYNDKRSHIPEYCSQLFFQ